MQHDAKIFVSGGRTLVGAAILRALKREGFTHLVGVDDAEPDYRDASGVEAFFAQARPDYVFVTAGRSGGIGANREIPAALMLDNLHVVSHVLPAAYQHGARKLLYVASSCSYPRLAEQPMAVESLMSGPLEPTNEAYALAKLAGIGMCRALRQQYGAAFNVAIPANDFGPGDDFGPDGHVIGALMRRMHEAKIAGAAFVEVWGSGRARREFIFSDDLADACLFLMRHYDDAQPINVGSGNAMTIAELAARIREVVGFEGELRFDASKPDGMPLKALDSAPLIALGWRAPTPFDQALRATYQSFLETGRKAVHV